MMVDALTLTLFTVWCAAQRQVDIVRWSCFGADKTRGRNKVSNGGALVSEEVTLDCQFN